MQQYVTYGLGKEFRRDLIKVNLECSIGKPKSAWWGSPIDAEFGWKDWCEAEEWFPSKNGLTLEEYFSDNNKIIWQLTDDTKVLDINSEADLYRFLNKGYIVNYHYPWLSIEFCDHYLFDFKKMLDDGYSAVELHDPRIGHFFCNNFAFDTLLNSWDCQSIVVLDPEKIEVLEES